MYWFTTALFQVPHKNIFFDYVRIRFFVVCLDYVRKHLYTTVTFHFSSSLWHYFCYVTTKFQCFCYNNTFNVVFWYAQVTHNSYVINTLFFGLSLWDTLCYVTTIFCQVPKNVFLTTLEMRCLLVRSNYVRKLDTITLRVGSSFLGYFFVVRLHNILK